MPTSEAFAKVLAFARERGARSPHTKGSCPAYIAPAMVLAFSARLRGIEVCTLTDVHRLDQGVHGERRKGSRASITEWNSEMTEAWETLVTRRDAIWNRDGRNFAIPIRPEKRFLLVEQTGNPIARSSTSSAWQRFIRMAISEGVIEESERFSMHGLKHRGVTDTAGNLGDKQDAAGHKSPTTTGRYDHGMPVVKPPRRR
ncbi:integrase [Stenotrophomonas maltophilia]|nr:integrase [Stenotrophomonas maltophilia]